MVADTLAAQAEAPASRDRRASEWRLIEAARGGDPRAVTALLDRVSPTVYRFGRSFCRDPHDAEDVMQDVFTALTHSIGAFRGDASLSTWAYVVAQRACARRRRRHPHTGDDASAAATVADPAAGPAELAEARELREVLEAAIRELPAPQRDVLMLRDVEGRPSREVARSLRIGEAAVKSRLHRARAAVRARIEAYRRGDMPRPAECAETPAMLRRFLSGGLTPEACARVGRHLDRCRACRSACASLRDALRVCHTWGRAPVPAPMRSHLRRAVRAVLGDLRAPRTRTRTRRARVAASAGRP